MSNTNINGNWYETIVGKEIISKKYLHEGEDFPAFVERVAGIFSDELHDDIVDALYDADFFPAGRSLYSAGSKGKFRSTMSNCYIMDSPQDNIEDIFETAKKTARIFSMGGGVGINVSKLRPRDAKVHNAAKTSTGAVSFLNIFNGVGEVIGANNRRAALMLGMDVGHPDIEEFLTIKQNDTAIQSANLSILFTDDFMFAVEDKADFELNFTVESTGEVISKTIDAYDFFQRFCASNWDYAEPGMLFIDNVRSNHLLSGYPKEEYHIDICNPCAEYTGAAYNACNLGSINMYNMVKSPFTSEATFDIHKFRSMVKLGITALDEILDYGLDSQPLPENAQAVIDYRAVGLGVFGLADMFIALGITYGSKESIDFITYVMDVMLRTALETSCYLADLKGTFAKYNWDYVKESPFLKSIEGTDLWYDIEGRGLRNGSLLSIAPTGSIATMVGLSGGVEPLYAVSYDRTTHALEKTGGTFKVFAKSVSDFIEAKGINKNNPGVTDEFLKEFPYITVSHDINPMDRVKLQATIQKYVDNAISSTVNLKNTATPQDIFDTYMMAWKSGCKGLTVFRDGCARTSILGKEKPKEPKIPKLNYISPVKRRSIGTTSGQTIVKHTSCSPNMYITVNSQDDNVFEVFTNSSQGCQSNINTITRMASLSLRSGVKVEEVIKELRSNTCSACTVMKSKGAKGISISCGAAIAESIEEIYKGSQVIDEFTESKEFLACPECHELTMLSSAKCPTCSNCGFSKCD